MNIELVDITVVGCGPVGASVALALANAGHEVTIVEEYPNPYPYLRAVMLDAYSCAILKELLGDDYARIQMRATPAVGYYLDKYALDRPFAWSDMDIGDERKWFIQPQLESIMREVVAKHPRIRCLFGHAARQLHSADGRAHITIEEVATGKSIDIATRWLMACDGGNSFVRKQMGGEMQSLGDNVGFLVVDARVPPDKLAGKPGHVYQIVDQERPTTFLPMGVDNYCRWEFRVNRDDNILELQSPQRILELLRPWAAPEHVELLRHTVYRFNSLIARKWRVGNVFLCGDAAHQTSPFLGQGLNMGLRNARNLCQKLILVLQGSARDELLDQDQAECFDATRSTIEQALKMGKLLFNTSPTANALRAIVKTVRAGRHIDISEQVAPTARVLAEATRVDRSIRKALPHTRIRVNGGRQTFLTLFDPARPKVLVRGRPKDCALGLDALPPTVRPDVRYVATGTEEKTADDTIVIPDRKQSDALFGAADYVVMLENSVLVGRYTAGEEGAMARDLRSVYRLKA